ncbi:MAG: amidohydrolase family protein [Planctomycetales bacterium]
MPDWIVTDEDRELFERELDSFVPETIFDAHAHWYSTRHFAPEALSPFLKEGPADAGADAFRQAMQEMIPGRKIDGLFFPYPNKKVDTAAANEFIVQELKHAPGSYGQMLITPEMDPEFIREKVRGGSFAGLKCYHVYSQVQPTWESPIEDFLPESHVKIAHEEGLSITLHIVRARALADRVNQKTLRRYCGAYPNMRMILAHAGRGFNPHHTLEGIDSLKGLTNVWFDTSAITDSGAFEAILRTFGPERLLYGADYPVSQLRGRCVALGDSFFWISEENTQLKVPYADLKLSLVGLESLRSLKLAAYACRLSDTEVEGIFRTYARQLFP